MGNKEYQGFDIEMIDLTGSENVVTSSLSCKPYTMWPDVDLAVNADIKQACTEMIYYYYEEYSGELYLTYQKP